MSHKRFQDLTLSMLLEIARRNDAPIVTALVHRVESDRELIGELAMELDYADAALATWAQMIGNRVQPTDTSDTKRGSTDR